MITWVVTVYASSLGYQQYEFLHELQVESFLSLCKVYAITVESTRRNDHGGILS